MDVIAHIQPLLNRNEEQNNKFYRTLEIQMQRLGHLIAYREQLNWTTNYSTIQLGNINDLKGLKKAAAKNDGVLLFYAKLTKGTVFQHIICHPNAAGIYLPFPFDEPFVIEVDQQKIWIGSSQRILEELNWLKITMQTQSDTVNAYWSNFITACEISVNKVSPIILKKTHSESTNDS